ncbi:MAG: wax ester/triacylglycerol synthase family O-acyltransferase [Acidobacteria bacterium]|nr:MAG: wax ester/triacylglycerol synthase family O-acyltransferase [Acidobacteriota bacterium]
MTDRPRREPMSRVDAAWLRMDQPTNRMIVTGVMFFEQPVDYARLRRLIEDRMLRFRRFRQRVVDPGVPLAGPYWIDDRPVDLDHHLVRERLPEPADETVLQRRVGELMATPLDPERPLWQFHCLEHEPGRSRAVVCRIHHCIADGIALIYVMMSLMDQDGAAGALPAQERQDGPPEDDEDGRTQAGSPLEAMLRGLRRALGSTWSAAGSVLEEGLQLFTEPHRTLDLAALAVSGLGSLAKLLTLPADSDTLFRGTLGIEKACAWSRDYPLPQVKEIARVFGGTINDVLVTAAAGALRRYMVERGESPDGVEIRAMIPVNLRPLERASELGNHFGLVYLSLPVGIEDPFDRFLETKARMDAIKRSPEALVAFQVLRGLGYVPRGGTTPVVEMFARKATAVMTNVPGPREPISLAGSRLERAMFWVPRSGPIGLGLSILSYAGRVYVGIATDAGLVPDPQRIAEHFHDELAAMVELVELPRRDGMAP